MESRRLVHCRFAIVIVQDSQGAIGGAGRAEEEWDDWGR